MFMINCLTRQYPNIIKGAVILLAVYTDFLRNRKKAG